jgi:predicted ribosomally synthesized peptide with nif11-like leader
MAIQNAKNFLKEAMNNRDFRRLVQRCSTHNEFEQFKIEQGYSFSLVDMEEASTMMHVGCETEEQANDFFSIIQWYTLFLKGLET